MLPSQVRLQESEKATWSTEEGLVTNEEKEQNCYFGSKGVGCGNGHGMNMLRIS